MKTPHRSNGASPWKGGKQFGGKKFGEKKRWDRGSDGRDSAKVFMHKSTCSECGKSCEVPFKPTGVRPIFCSFCFDKKEKLGETHSFEKTGTTNNHDIEQLKEQLRIVNTKLDTILKAIKED